MTWRYIIEDEAAIAASLISFPLSGWPGNCTWVAESLNKSGLALYAGKTRYGLYFGPIAETGHYAGSKTPQRHSWIEAADGSIIDPTRWVFEDVPPYIYRGPNNGEYDIGASRLRAMLRTPPPKFEGSPVTLTVPGEAKDVLLTLLGGYGFSKAQIFWLANAHPSELGIAAAPFYRWLAHNGLKVAVPMDYWKLVME